MSDQLQRLDAAKGAGPIVITSLKKSEAFHLEPGAVNPSSCCDQSNSGCCESGDDELSSISAVPFSDTPCCGPSVVSTPINTSVVGAVSRDGYIQVPSKWAGPDVLGAFKVRLGISRMSYGVAPGLYAVGSPDNESPVVASANYKLSFDHLRRALDGIDAWIVVLQTYGVNVWCAAGKGTFGTEELVSRIREVDLTAKVSNRRIIVPQLGAPGVAAHRVKKETGFKVVYGPVLAKDLPQFLDNKLKATPAMREKKFTMWERAVLIPVELVMALKGLLLMQLLFLALSAVGTGASILENIWQTGVPAAIGLALAVVLGAVLTPLLLPFLPGRAFSLKSFTLSIVGTVLFIHLAGIDLTGLSGQLLAGAYLLLLPAIAAFLAMNFTGASTYTSLSGVKKEMKVAVPLEAVGAGLGSVLFVASRLVGA